MGLEGQIHFDQYLLNVYYKSICTLPCYLKDGFVDYLSS